MKPGGTLPTIHEQAVARARTRPAKPQEGLVTGLLGGGRSTKYDDLWLQHQIATIQERLPPANPGGEGAALIGL